MYKDKKIFIAGHRGLVGSAIARKLLLEGCKQVLTQSRHKLDLLNKLEVDDFFKTEKPDIVILAAAKVGGILANKTYPADFLYDNLSIQLNVIDSAYRNGTQRLLFLGSSCIYPKQAPQPLKEEYILTSELETTNEAYAIAKIAGVKMCQAYSNQYGFDSVSVMPTNLYGQNDNFDLAHSHVLPALIRKFHDAKIAGASKVEIWGTGTPKREFLHVDDLADACVFLLQKSSDEIRTIAPDGMVNVGLGEDVSIREVAQIIKETVGFFGDMEFDTTKPDGTPRKLMDVSRMSSLGWKAKISLEEGIRKTYQWFQFNYPIIKEILKQHGAKEIEIATVSK